VLWGNPFEELEPGLVHQISKRVLSDEAEESVKCALKIGMEKSEKFKHDRVSLYQTIHRNKLPIFRKKNDVVASKKKQAVASIKEQVSMFKDLYIGCKARPDGDLNQFFSHENHEYPPALSEYGQLRHATAKSDFMKIISNQDLEAHQSPDVEAIVVDGAPWIHTHPPRSSIKFEEYCTSEIIGPLRRLSAQRIDLVFDVYKENSMKSQERERRGRDTGRYIVRKDTPIPKNFGKAILKNEKSKTELFEMVADMISSTESDTVFVSTKGESVMSNKSIPKDHLSPCNQDDADTRVFFHAMDIAKQYRKIMIITVDTDLIVIGLSIFSKLDIDELWIQLGTGKNKRWFPIHIYANHLGEDVCKALPFWYAFTGCDTTSQFSGRGKKSGWKTWTALPQLTNVFIRLSNLVEITDEDKVQIERFVCVLYDRGSKFSSVNSARRFLFTTSNI
jgi:hypothetical protein